jgi:hypothetical protein
MALYVLARDEARILLAELQDWRHARHGCKLRGRDALQSTEAFLRFNSGEIYSIELTLDCLDRGDAGLRVMAGARINVVNPAVEHDGLDRIDLVDLEHLVHRP